MFSCRQILMMFLPICTALGLADAQPVPSSRAAVADVPAIAFHGQDFALYKAEPILNGWSAYYTVNAQNSDSAPEEIIISHMDARDARGQVVLPAQVFRAMLDKVKSRGGTIIEPTFAVPDMTRPGDQYTYHAAFYYVYTKDRIGDIWMSRVFSTDNGVVGILYRRTMGGSEPAALERDMRSWIAQNLVAYGDSLEAVVVPAQPYRPSSPSPQADR